MSREIMRVVVDKFNRSEFVYFDDIPMDGEIAEFIYELNKSKDIITTNSCAGHDRFESGAEYDFISHPYLSFIVSEKGWNLFWQNALPQISEKVLVHLQIANEAEKIGIIIRSHYDDKKDFWEIVKPTFLKYYKP